MADRVFLTEQREQFIEGEYPGGINQRTLKHRLTNSSRTALDELTQIAQSEELDNADVFPPGALIRFVEAILGPAEEIEPRYEVYNLDDSDADPDALEAHRAKYGYQEETVRGLDRRLGKYTHRFETLPPRGPVDGMQTEDGGPVPDDDE